jgi:hypothetical protein
VVVIRIGGLAVGDFGGEPGEEVEAEEPDADDDEVEGEEEGDRQFVAGLFFEALAVVSIGGDVWFIATPKGVHSASLGAG